jgi:hypothetical protein
MHWKFTINEVSAGHFSCTAIRDDGRNISLDGDDTVIARILHEAYLAEVSIATSGGAAAFEITHSFLHRWSAVYHTGMMGSWTVSDVRSGRQIDYDGRDMYLMVTREPSAYSWQGGIAELSKPRCHFYRELSTI